MADRVRDAIYELLVADATLTNPPLLPDAEHIYHRSGPQDVDFPMVVIAKQSGGTLYSFGTGGNYYVTNELWTVKGIDRGMSSTVAEDLDVRCFELLQDAELAVDGRTVMWMRREEDVDYGEREEGAIIHHVGAMYRLLTEPVA